MRESFRTTTIWWVFLVVVKLREKTWFVIRIIFFDAWRLYLINFWIQVPIALSLNLIRLRVVWVFDVARIVFSWPCPIVIRLVHETHVKNVNMAQVKLFNIRQVHLWNVWRGLNALWDHCFCDSIINWALVFLIDECHLRFILLLLTTCLFAVFRL